MGLQDYAYRLRPQAGDTQAHDELAVSGNLSGTGTLTLVDRGGGDVAWQLTGGTMTVAVPAKQPVRTAAADGVTLALRLRVVNYGTTDFAFFAGVGITTDLAGGIRIGRTSAGNLRSRYALNATTTAYAQAAGSDFTVVLRAATAGAAAEVLSLFRSGPTTDTNAQTTVDQNMSTFVLACEGTMSVQVADAVWWREELSDTDCQTLVADGIRASLDVGDTTAPVITGPGGATGATSSVTVNENSSAVHTFTADESVTWSLNGGADAALFSINSSTGALTFTSAPDFESPGDADTNNVYVVVVRATDGASPSNTTDQTVSVTVADVVEGTPPTITSQPSSTSRKVGQTATFSVTATGTAPITYQWRLDGTPISGATSSSYTTGTLAIGDSGGVYSVAVTDPNGTTVSSGATLTVTACTLDLSAVQLTDIVGLDLSGISDAAGVSVRSEAYAEGLTMGSPVATSSAAATSGTGVPASITDNALQFGATYVVIITEQAGSAPRRRAMVEVVAG